MDILYYQKSKPFFRLDNEFLIFKDSSLFMFINLLHLILITINILFKRLKKKIVKIIVKLSKSESIFTGLF